MWQNLLMVVILYKFITAMAWMVGPILTILIPYGAATQRDWQPARWVVALMIVADAWLIARYL